MTAVEPLVPSSEMSLGWPLVAVETPLSIVSFKKKRG